MSCLYTSFGMWAGVGVVVSVHSCVWVESMKSCVLILSIFIQKCIPISICVLQVLLKACCVAFTCSHCICQLWRMFHLFLVLVFVAYVCYCDLIKFVASPTEMTFSIKASVRMEDVPKVCFSATRPALFTCRLDDGEWGDCKRLHCSH